MWRSTATRTFWTFELWPQGCTTSRGPRQEKLFEKIALAELGQVLHKLGPSWTKLGPSCAKLGPNCGSVRAKLGLSWGQVGQNRPQKLAPESMQHDSGTARATLQLCPSNQTSSYNKATMDGAKSTALRNTPQKILFFLRTGRGDEAGE